MLERLGTLKRANGLGPAQGNLAALACYRATKEDVMKMYGLPLQCGWPEVVAKVGILGSFAARTFLGWLKKQTGEMNFGK